MKKLKLQLLVLMISLTSFAQVGIGTTTPNGALDITSTNEGLLIPRIALENTITATVATPTISEMVYNTFTSAVGPNQVTPGFYYWDGAKWVQQLSNSFTQTFTQTSSNGINTAGSYVNINGLTANSFVAPYSGNYQFIFLGYLGAGRLTGGGTTIGVTEGNFRFTVNGVDNIKYLHSETFKLGGGGKTEFYQLFNEITIIVNVTLVSGATCNLNVSYDGLGSNDLATPENVIGNSLVYGNFCSVNVTYTGK
jgi:hypothetical protein